MWGVESDGQASNIDMDVADGSARFGPSDTVTAEDTSRTDVSDLEVPDLDVHPMRVRHWILGMVPGDR